MALKLSNDTDFVHWQINIPLIISEASLTDSVRLLVRGGGGDGRNQRAESDKILLARTDVISIL